MLSLLPPLRILHVVGARPNFMKIAPLVRAMAQCPADFEQRLIHTGQHYDPNLSDVFFEELGLPRPDANLGVGSGTHAEQTANIMLRFEPVLAGWRPDWVVVPGDVNSTLACTLVASKLGIRVAHLEAGLRSFDRTMPEELNRLVTDQLADLLLTPARLDGDNLVREGVAPDKIRFVGNIMLDSLRRLLPRAQTQWPRLAAELGLQRFVLVTLHRPGNVDDPATLAEILAALSAASRHLPVVFPLHPRTRQRMADHGLSVSGDVRLIPPLGYIDFLALQAHAAVVVTDSGGVQEETTYLGVPCLTVRPNTERPITLTHGTNRLVGPQRQVLGAALEAVLAQPAGARGRALPELWDGETAARVVAVFQSLPRPMAAHSDELKNA